MRPAIAEITRIIRPRVLAPAIVSAVLLALATLVKPVPALLLPALAPRWGWKGSLAYALMLGAGLALYSGAGWGLTGSLEAGTGIFGATRIYLARWNFNAGLYHWLEALATGRYSPGAAPMGIAGIEAAKAVSAAGTLAVMAGVAWKAWARRGWLDPAARPGLLLAPLAAYLLLTPTVHPWYLAPLIAVLPFCMASSAGHALTVIPWLCFSISAGLSYLTYLDPLNLRETDFARRWEYLPVYALLALQALARRPARR